MKLTNRPKFKKYTFAAEATKSTIEEVPQTQSQEQEAQGFIGYQHGYTEFNMKPITEGGKPPRGQQLNQILKDITEVTQYATMGGTYPMDTDIIQSTGYSKNAILCVDGVGLFRSLQDDNKESDYNDSAFWQLVVPFEKEVKKSWVLIKDYTFSGEKELIIDNLYGGMHYKLVISNLRATSNIGTNIIHILCQAKFGNDYITTQNYYRTSFAFTNRNPYLQVDSRKDSKYQISSSRPDVTNSGLTNNYCSYLEIDILPNQQNVKMLKCYLQTFTDKYSNSMYEVNSSCSILGNGGTFSGIKIYNELSTDSSTRYAMNGHVELYSFSI